MFFKIFVARMSVQVNTCIKDGDNSTFVLVFVHHSLLLYLWVKIQLHQFPFISFRSYSSMVWAWEVDFDNHHDDTEDYSWANQYDIFNFCSILKYGAQSRWNKYICDISISFKTSSISFVFIVCIRNDCLHPFPDNKIVTKSPCFPFIIFCIQPWKNRYLLLDISILYAINLFLSFNFCNLFSKKNEIFYIKL